MYWMKTAPCFPLPPPLASSGKCCRTTPASCGSGCHSNNRQADLSVPVNPGIRVTLVTSHDLRAGGPRQRLTNSTTLFGQRLDHRHVIVVETCRTTGRNVE